MLIRKVPSWESCPAASSSDSIWSMVATQAETRNAMVLGMSILKTWNYSYTLPDLRLIVITPTNIERKSLLRLEEIGWGICYIQQIDYLLVGVKKYRVQYTEMSLKNQHEISVLHFQDAFGKVHLWNMTQYKVIHCMSNTNY